MRLLMMSGFVATLVASSFSAFASGDFPLASCAGWNGSIVDKIGVGSADAHLLGLVTAGDLLEYCERDPGGSTIANGGTQTVTDCLNELKATEENVVLKTTANCRTGELSFQYGNNTPRTAVFPLDDYADTSCASGLLPLIQQYELLCQVPAEDQS